MNKTSLYLPGLLLASSLALAETVSTPATTVPASPVAPAAPAQEPAAKKVVRTVAAPAKPVAPAAPAAIPAPAVSVTPAKAPVTPVAAAAVTPQVTDAPPVAPPVITIEQRRQQEMLVNAERVDKANRELLARNQELQLQLENLAIQNNVLKHDRSNEGIWKGAGAVIVGFIMGWFFSGAGRRKSSW
ncbi:MAG: hypothetical protein Q7T32_09405 [Moraxellaceae bacterium]|nr:hypothetical protein [Moraxellaceae bacterium]